ncbi:tRNA dihydrouridine synthase [Salidesulfovibrio onnuriiensis]|uniref:tRNA dihydrouridine synthase n=1 Tax=Salidesulfovibrio onnuriiensis TaxID=2583823 RepID=UPI0011CC4F14|nr:tRNA-dihydrouridine synthase family protein [Salidesulfovibrio onnuriiensis]
MVGLGHVAFRQVLEGYGGCGLMVSEMCSALGLPKENPATSPIFKFRKEELPHLSCQLAGARPEEFVPAARRVEAEGFFGVDINMGCSVGGICKKGCGADLLRAPDRAVDVVRAVRQAVGIPVTIKFRTGWSGDPGPAVNLGKAFEQAGADALVFHPRVAPDKRSRPPVWDHIRLLKEAVSIPVIGNGNVCTPDDALKMFEHTGCDGIALGRMAIARPWIFSQMAGDNAPREDAYRQYALKLLDAIEEHFDHPARQVKLFKKIAVYITANFSYGLRMQSELLKGNSMARMRENVNAALTPDRPTTERPNALMFTS